MTGPSPTPLGTGSLQLNTTDADGANNAKAQLFNYSYIGTKLSDITALSYSDYHSSSSSPANSDARASINIGVDYVGDGTSFATFIYEPYRQSGGLGALQSDSWQSWNTLDGKWWASKDIPGSPLPIRQSTQASWSQIIAAFPNAKIVSGIGFNVGSGWSGTTVNNADALTIGVNGSTTTYDFEKTPPLICRVWIWTNQNQPCSFTSSNWVSNFFQSLSGSWWPFRGGFR